jgi:hypothetical protein
MATPRVTPLVNDAVEETRLIEDWAGLDRATRKRRWDLLDGKRRKVLTDAFGNDLFEDGS